MIRVMVVDDHTVVREGLKRIIDLESDMRVVKEGASGEEAIQGAMAGDIDVMVLDVTMPGRSGLDALTEIKKLRPHIRVIILSMLTEEQAGVRALRAGASGYLTKESAPDEMVRAIRKVSEGVRYITPGLAEKLASIIQDGEDTLHAKLSNREFEVLRLLAKGKSVTEIAKQLSLSDRTVSTYRSRILEKIGVSSNADLVRYALEHKLID